MFINLLDEKHAMYLKVMGTLTINVDTNNKNKIYNRVLLQTKINWTKCKPLLLNLDHVSESLKGNATFLAEIIENSAVDTIIKNKSILRSSYLHNTSGKLTNETFILCPEIAEQIF